MTKIICFTPHPIYNPVTGTTGVGAVVMSMKINDQRVISGRAI